MSSAFALVLQQVRYTAIWSCDYQLTVLSRLCIMHDVHCTMYNYVCWGGVGRVRGRE